MIFSANVNVVEAHCHVARNKLQGINEQITRHFIQCCSTQERRAVVFISSTLLANVYKQFWFPFTW